MPTRTLLLEIPRIDPGSQSSVAIHSHLDGVGRVLGRDGGKDNSVRHRRGCVRPVFIRRHFCGHGEGRIVPRAAGHRCRTDTELVRLRSEIIQIVDDRVPIGLNALTGEQAQSDCYRDLNIDHSENDQ
jgi:hypothetical protein